ncbi:hypothetical protein E4695_04185 [Alcaligenaceae bacterium 429]|nr:hypothetical protein E4695_04185 [Alcaligenaceae bacterium 429]
MTKALNRFVGRPHIADSYDCADLAVEVARELFARDVVLPTHRPRPHGQRGQALAIQAMANDLAFEVTEPVDGDLVLMQSAGQELPGHIGTYFFVNYQPHVLHTSVALGQASLHKLTALPAFSLRVVGFYRWKEHHGEYS